jgi:quinol monooxygenase YgiN
VVFETYRDRAAFEDHLGSAHSIEFNRRLTPLVEGGGSRLTWLSEVADG